MNFKSLLEKKVSPKLAECGFSYEGKSHPLGWTYVRELGNVKQFVTFSKSPLDSHDIRFELSTSLRPQDIIYSDSFLGKNRFENGGYWHFNDESSLDAILNEMLAILIEKGLGVLDILSVPDLLPTKDQEKLFFATYRERAERICAEWNMDCNDEMKLSEVERTLIDRKKDDTFVDWDLIMAVAVYFGELLVNTLGGEWAWDELRSIPVVRKLGGKPNAQLNPLSAVSKYWGNPVRSDYSLQGIYHRYKLLATL
jgi:hypothetical protein